MKKNYYCWGLLMCFLLLYGVSAKAQTYNYNDALLKAVNFFDANKCGSNVALDNVFSWRGACHTTDGSAVSLDLSGGFHDAGDHVKFGLPQCWSAATLGFALYEFKESFDNAKATTKLLSELKYFTDYFLKCHPNANTFYYQVGDGNVDHGYWGSPELQTGARPVIVNNTSAPASDVLGEAAAALALMYLNYKSIDLTYANKCLTAAKELFTLGKTNLGRSSDGGGGAFYKSTSHFDDLSWGAIWLSIATGDNTYLAPVDGWIDQKNDGGDDPYNKHWAPAWDDVTLYVLLKMYELTGTQKYFDGINNNMVWYSTTLKKTAYGMPWLDTWGVLRYNSAEAGLGYLAAKKFQYADYLKTADLCMNYICGTNPRNSSYLTGWGTNPPVHPHHRANEPVQGGPTHGIVGGLVGGPDMSDAYSDVVGNYQQTEVAIDYNSAFLLGMAGKIYFTLHTPPKVNVPPTVSLTAPSASGTYNQGTPITLSANAADADGTVTNVEFYVSGSKVGEDATAPYSFSWTPQLSGSYTITAHAIDDRKSSTTSTAVTINVSNNNLPPTTPNLALNKTATSSSDENSGLTANNVVDGNYSSRWGSAFGDPQWLQVDLGSAQTINRVILSWESAYATAYSIQVSTNGTTWTTVASIVGGNGSTDDITFASTTARYVRMYGTARVTTYGYSIYEFEVYGSSANIPVTSVTVAPATATINVGLTSQLTATVAPATATNQTITWSSSNTSVATVSATGVVTGVALGTATITVTTVDGAKVATCLVTVQNGNILVTGVTLLPSAVSIAPGATSQLTATVAPSNATNKNVTWSTSSAAVATVSATGLVTAIANGTATITVTTVDGAKTAISTITVSSCTPTTIVPYVQINSGAWTQTSTANASVGNSVTFGPQPVSGGSWSWIGPNGFAAATREVTITNIQTTQAGNYVATYTNASGCKSTNTFVVTVGGTTIAVTGVTLAPTAVSISSGGSSQLTATVAPANATNKTVAWSSSNNLVATVSATGLVTAVGAGTATITVTTQDGNFTATCAVTVTIISVSVTGVSVTPATSSITVGGTAQLTATVAPANATNKTIAWTSSNNLVATVSAAGLVTGVAAGNATITATTRDGNFTSTCAVTVTGGSTSCAFGTPLASALPSISKAFNYIYVLGAGPSFANVSNMTINWDLANKGLYQLSMGTKDGKPNWYVDLRASATQTFASAQPSITFSGTGFPGLDGNYYAAIDNGNFVLVEKSGSYTIYFSNSAIAPVCTKSAEGELASQETVLLYPNPFTNKVILQVSNMGDVKSVKVINQLGITIQILDVNQFKNNQVEFGDNLPTGIYFIQVKDKDNTKVYKVIKK